MSGFPRNPLIAQSAKKLQAINIWKIVIQKNAVGPIGPALPQSALATIGLGNDEGALPSPFEQATANRPIFRAVIDDQYAARFDVHPVSGSLGQNDDLEPVIRETLNGLQESIEIHGLHDVAVGSQLIAFVDISLVG